MRAEVPWIAETCRRCGRPLKTDSSRGLGYGPVCLRKVEADQEEAQTNIDEYIGGVKDGE